MIVMIITVLYKELTKYISHLIGFIKIRIVSKLLSHNIANLHTIALN